MKLAIGKVPFRHQLQRLPPLLLRLDEQADILRRPAEDFLLGVTGTLFKGRVDVGKGAARLFGERHQGRVAVE